MAPAPVAFAPSSREAFQQAAAATLPSARQILRIGWRAADRELEFSGSGAVRVAPPDSLRLDAAATLGLGRSTLIITGDSVDARPAEAVDQIMPERFALWAVLGIMRAPSGRLSYEVAESPDRSYWRVTDQRERQTIFELHGGVLAGVTRLELGHETSLLRLTRNAAGEVTRANLVDTGRQFRLQLDVNRREPSEAFAPEIWHLRP